jgi:hypothetical protein
MSQHQGLRVSEIAEIIGAITVVIGLIFVGYELNQNTKIQRVTATQTLVSEYERALDVLANEREAACVYMHGINDFRDMSSEDRLRFAVIFFQSYRSAEQLHYYAEEGLV